MALNISLSPEKREKCLDLVRNYDLSPTVLDFVERYEAILGGTDLFGNGLEQFLSIQE